MSNTVIVTGRVTTVPEIKKTKDGNLFMNFLIADNSHETTEFYRVNKYTKSERCLFEKGDQVKVTGKFTVNRGSSGIPVVAINIQAFEVSATESKAYRFARKDKRIMEILNEGAKKDEELAKN